MNAAQEKLTAEILKAHEAAEAAELTWSERERSVSMTNAEWNRLRCFLLMTTKFRQGEIDSWSYLAAEVDDDGAPRFPNAAKNAEYWSDRDSFIEAFGAKIDAL